MLVPGLGEKGRGPDVAPRAQSCCEPGSADAFQPLPFTTMLELLAGLAGLMPARLCRLTASCGY